MKLKLFAKLFLLLFFGMLLLLASMVFTIHLNFKQGLSTYLENTEQEKLQQLALQLGDFYQQHDGWQDLQDNPRFWFAWLNQTAIAKNPQAAAAAAAPSTPEDELGFEDPPPHPHDHDGSSPHPHHGPHPFRRPNKDGYILDVDRLFIFDTAGQRIIGPPDRIQPVEGEQRIALQSLGQPIGWLLVKPNHLISDHLALTFMRQQVRGNLWRLGFALVFSVLMALVMTRQILRPLQRLATGLHALTDGQLTTQIPERGHDELTTLAKDFNRLGRTLAHSEHTRQQWLADISHELRTPLAVLRGELEALVDGIRTATPERILSLHQEVLSLTRLVDDLYQLSLSDLGALDYRFESVELGQLIRQITDAFQSRFAGKTLALNFSPPAQAIYVHGDGLRLAQLLSNVLENSYRYTDAGGVCRVTLAQLGTTTTIHIDDSAPSVDSAELPMLFDRFHRVERSRQRHTGGAGLGLALCRTIVTAHGGNISATASDLGGVRITIQL